MKIYSTLSLLLVVATLSAGCSSKRNEPTPTPPPPAPQPEQPKKPKKPYEGYEGYTLLHDTGLPIITMSLRASLQPLTSSSSTPRGDVLVMP